MENGIPAQPVEEWKVSSQQPAESWRVWPSKPLPLEPPAPPPRRSFANRVAADTGPWYTETPSWPYPPSAMEPQQAYPTPESEHQMTPPMAYEPQSEPSFADEEKEKREPPKKKQSLSETAPKQKSDPGGRF